MRIENIDVTKTLEEARAALKKEKNLSRSTTLVFELLITIVVILINRMGLNSKNSSKPPSTDNNTDRSGDKNKKKKRKKNKGGQNGHEGKTLHPVDNPDKIEELKIDRRTLPRGEKYSPYGYVARQEFNIKISKNIIEYRAERLIDQHGNVFTAKFPEGITHRAQYGASIKSRVVYLSVQQMIPYERIQDQFKHDAGLEISTGSLVNFKHDAAKKLFQLKFDLAAKQGLANSTFMHNDETGINIAGKRVWLHGASNDMWTWSEPHQKRGTEAMKDINILPHFSGISCHDHWKPYYQYDCTHALCNAHHIRELTRAHEQDKQAWASEMRSLLVKLNKVTKKHGGMLTGSVRRYWRKKYFGIIAQGEKECPPTKRKKGQRGKIKQTESRNLLVRLKEYADDVLRFIDDTRIPFTNNDGEQNIRMNKVQQKISGSFISFDTAKDHYILKSYIETCKKRGISPSTAVEMIFKGKLPEFMQEEVNKIPDTS